MSKSGSPDAAALFQKVTGETELVDEQEDSVSHDAATEEDEAYFDEAREDGLDDAVAAPEMGSE
ncbi:hypothetical protein [Haloarchaeobius sp. HME9146]|uniref:hypothetical protein n=1 Tax=unclassified Haloarchaeobius TaxID=2614452 RepID=UPI0021C0BD4F|nr:hypothetical protein [Haloarchaeobius sp. HME9146]MCT9095612.1 hypothetical protein [Haloarchaeobius sp. HME9146]